MKTLYKLEEILGRIIVGLAGTGMAAITIIVFVQVIYRYIIGFSLSWAEELSLYLEVWIVFLVSGYALGKGEHVCMDIVSSRLRGIAKIVVEKIIAAGCLVYAIANAVFGWQYMIGESSQRMAAIPASKSLVYAALFVGFVIMVFYALVLLLERPGAGKEDASAAVAGVQDNIDAIIQEREGDAL